MENLNVFYKKYFNGKLRKKLEGKCVLDSLVTSLQLVHGQKMPKKVSKIFFVRGPIEKKVSHLTIILKIFKFLKGIRE